MLKSTVLYPLRTLLQKCPSHSLPDKDYCIPNIIHKRGFADKSDKPPGPAKEEKITIKMPGFVYPENIKEEGYFTQKAKQQLEELKRKGLPTIESTDKKD